MKNLMTKTSIALGLALNLTACYEEEQPNLMGIDNSSMDQEEAMVGTALLSVDEAPVVTPIEPPSYPHP
jgi:hypothetical protein